MNLPNVELDGGGVFRKNGRYFQDFTLKDYLGMFNMSIWYIPDFYKEIVELPDNILKKIRVKDLSHFQSVDEAKIMRAYILYVRYLKRTNLYIGLKQILYSEEENICFASVTQIDPNVHWCFFIKKISEDIFIFLNTGGQHEHIGLEQIKEMGYSTLRSVEVLQIE